jgi:hypothetical protein
LELSPLALLLQTFAIVPLVPVSTNYDMAVSQLFGNQLAHSQIKL